MFHFRRSGRASTQLVTAATTSAVLQQERARSPGYTSPVLPPILPGNGPENCGDCGQVDFVVAKNGIMEDDQNNKKL